MNHSVPVSASFQVFKYINVTPSLQFTDRMYSNKIMRSWDQTNQTEVNDTVYGFYFCTRQSKVKIRMLGITCRIFCVFKI